MSPHTKGKEQAPVALKNISGEKTTEMPRGRRGGWGGGENGRKKPAQRKTARANESHGQCSQLLGMCMPKTADSQLKWFGISSGLFISYESTLNLRIKL